MTRKIRFFPLASLDVFVSHKFPFFFYFERVFTLYEHKDIIYNTLSEIKIQPPYTRAQFQMKPRT